jgi:hypothetical protein
VYKAERVELVANLSRGLPIYLVRSKFLVAGLEITLHPRIGGIHWI